MKDIFKQLLDSKIDWEESPETVYLQARFNDKAARLRFNDWPDEILCTIFIDSDEQDWEDWPDHWILPAHRKKQQSENVLQKTLFD